MGRWIDEMMVLLILTNLMLLGSSRLLGCIRYAALQGILTGFLPLLAYGNHTIRSLLLGTLIVGLKGFVFPNLLTRALREVDVRREVEPFVGYTCSTLIGLLAFGASLWLGARLPLPHSVATGLVMPVAISTVFVGLFLIVSRRKALTQVVGYLVLENGIYVFGLALLKDTPLLVELGILMDVFVAVFVMGILIFNISREFDHIDADQLNTLKG